MVHVPNKKESIAVLATSCYYANFMAKYTIMIILLTEPTGSGKTDTSWALLDFTKNMVFLDCDWFASLLPFSWQKNKDVEMVYQALSTMINFYLKKKHKNFVITLTHQMAGSYEKYKSYFEQFELPLYKFRLRCEESELKRRILARDRIEAQKNQELKDALTQQKFFDITFPDDTLFKLIDSTNLTEQQAASKIIEVTK